MVEGAVTVSIGICVSFYGDPDHWVPLAARAAMSAADQTDPADDVVVSKGESLHQARNEGMAAIDTDYMIHLDADDELDRHYVEAVREALELRTAATGTYLCQPSTLGVVDGVEDPEAVLIPQRPLRTGNFLVIGTAFPTRLGRQVGGFLDYPAWEDWAFFLRLEAMGAIPITVPNAIYRVHVNPDGRNSKAANDRSLFNRILQDHNVWLEGQ